MGNLNYNPGIYRSLGPGLEEDEPDTAGGFWDWWKRNGEEASDILDTGLCVINPRRAGCPGAPQSNPYQNGTSGGSTDRNLLYVIIGVVIVMLFILILKK